MLTELCDRYQRSLEVLKEAGKKNQHNMYIITYIPAPSNRSPLEAFVDLKVAGDDLFEGPGIEVIHIYSPGNGIYP